MLPYDLSGNNSEIKIVKNTNLNNLSFLLILNLLKSSKYFLNKKIKKIENIINPIMPWLFVISR